MKIFYFLSSSLFFITTCNAQDICFSQGSCEDGYHLNITLTETYIGCQEACISNEGCNYFTHEQTGGLCEFLSNCTQVNSTLCPTCYTGERDCPQVICSHAGMCQGNLVREYYTDTEQDCLEKCLNYFDCLWYSYYESVGYCVLTSDCNPTSSPNSVFGQKECYGIIDPRKYLLNF